MVTVNISLPDSIKEYVDKRLSEGQFTSTSEYILNLVREDQQRRADDLLEKLLLEGLDSGEPIEMTEEYVQHWRSTLIETIENNPRHGK